MMNKVKAWLETPKGQQVSHWATSSITTFLAGFILVLGLEIDSINVQSIEIGAVAGVFLAAVRGGVKALIQAFGVWYANKLSK